MLLESVHLSPNDRVQPWSDRFRGIVGVNIPKDNRKDLIVKFLKLNCSSPILPTYILDKTQLWVYILFKKFIIIQVVSYLSVLQFIAPIK